MANDETRMPRPGPDSEGYPSERSSATDEIVGSENLGSDGELDEAEFDDEDVDDAELDEEESEPE